MTSGRSQRVSEPDVEIDDCADDRARTRAARASIMTGFALSLLAATDAGSVSTKDGKSDTQRQESRLPSVPAAAINLHTN